VRTVAERGILCFATAAGPDRAVFFDRNNFRGFARSFVGAVAVGRVLGLSAGAESECLTGFRIDFVRRGLPAHGLIIGQSLENGSVNCGRWKAEGRVLPIFLIPIEKDAGGGVQGELVGFLKGTPPIFVRFLIKSDICL